MAEKLIYILFSIPGLAIIVAAIILNVKGKCSIRIKHSMGAMLFVVAVSMLCYAQFYNQGLASRYSWGFDFVYCLITPFCAPLYYVFINCLTDIRRRPALNVAVFLPMISGSVLFRETSLRFLPGIWPDDCFMRIFYDLPVGRILSFAL